MFTEVSWLQVMHGQGLRALGHHPPVGQYEREEIRRFVAAVAAVIHVCAEVTASHGHFIGRHCAVMSGASVGKAA